MPPTPTAARRLTRQRPCGSTASSSFSSRRTPDREPAGKIRTATLRLERDMRKLIGVAAAIVLAKPASSLPPPRRQPLTDPLHDRAREAWNTVTDAGARLCTSVPVVLE